MNTSSSLVANPCFNHNYRMTIPSFPGLISETKSSSLVRSQAINIIKYSSPRDPVRGPSRTILSQQQMTSQQQNTIHLDRWITEHLPTVSWLWLSGYRSLATEALSMLYWTRLRANITTGYPSPLNGLSPLSSECTPKKGSIPTKKRSDWVDCLFSLPQGPLNTTSPGQLFSLSKP